MTFTCRLGRNIYTNQLFKDRGGKSEWGKLKPLHRTNKVSSQREATWRYSLPSGVNRDHLKELCRKQLHNFQVLLRAVELHPGFQRDWDVGMALPLSQEMTSPTTTTTGAMNLSPVDLP
jgi:hypothetical protein